MTKSDMQTSLRLPTDLRDRLSAEAEKNGRGVGEEIRRRLEASFGPAPIEEDSKTAALLRQIASAARMLREEWRPWHADQGAQTVFRVAVTTLISEEKPTESVAPPTTGPGGTTFNRSPEDAGDILARMAQLEEYLR